jgi:methionine synthase II (cobalamin-independent)
MLPRYVFLAAPAPNPPGGRFAIDRNAREMDPLPAKFSGGGLPCLIGSLPMDDHAAAARAVQQTTPEIPAWAQLPRLAGEDMVSQFAAGLPGLDASGERPVVDRRAPGFDAELLGLYEEFLAESEGRPAGRRDEPRCPGIDALERELAARRAPPLALKGQVTGPFTLGVAVRDESGRAVFYDPQLRDAVVKHLAGRARRQAGRLARWGRPVLLFIDEPALSGFGSSEFLGVQPEEVRAALAEIVAAVHAGGALAGVHVCGNTDWELILESGADIVSFDAFAFFERFILYRPAFERFLAAGKQIAWGIVPTLDAAELARATAAGLAARLAAILERAAPAALPPPRLLARSLVTPSCGMGMLPPELALKALALTREVSLIIRQTEWKDA